MVFMGATVVGNVCIMLIIRLLVEMLIVVF